MDFDEDDLLSSEPRGSATVTEQSFFGGELTVVPSFDDAGNAVRFPEFSDSAEEPGVGIVAMAQEAPLPAPGEKSFRYGADVLFDVLGASSAADNGDNVLQRGLAADASQYKLQIDHGVPSCAVQGADARLMTKGDELEAATWYRLECRLDESGLELLVTDLETEESASFASPGTVGAVEFDDDVPIAIGRKAARGGVGIEKQPDQFNGTLDRVWISIATGR